MLSRQSGLQRRKTDGVAEMANPRSKCSALLPARAAKLTELFYLINGMADYARFGAGLEPPARDSSTSTGTADADPQAEETAARLSAFLERWMHDPKCVMRRKSQSQCC